MDQIITKETEVSVLVPAVWSSRYYDVLLAELPFNALISKDYEGEISALGDRVKISSVPEFGDAEIIGEADKADASAITVTQQELLINKHIVKDFMVTQRALLQSIPFVEKLKEMAVYAINKKIQSEIISLIVPNASAPDHSIAYASGTTLALADLLSGKELLDAQNVPMSDRHMVVGSAQLNDIFNITGFTSSDFVASGAPLQSGQLPAQLLGFMPHFTTMASNTTYLFHSSFMTMAAQKGLNVAEYAQDGTGLRATRVNCDTLIGIKQLDGLRVVTIS
jgi:Phage capsid protein